MSADVTAYYDAHGATVHHGDCLQVLAELGACSVDAVVTDPPYDLTASKRGGSGAASVNLDSPYGRARIGTGNGSGGFMGNAWDSTGVAFDQATWAAVLRVLKPGGHLLASGGTRTWHRMVCAVEDAGFEVRDSLAWLYGSGFPKSLDVSKAIDRAAGAEREVVGPNPFAGFNGKSNLTVYGVASRPDQTRPATQEARQWDGWGTALKPAFEPIVLARKPLEGTVAGNVLVHGTGALNIDACRVGDGSESQGVRMGEDSAASRYADRGATDLAATPGPRGGAPNGRWPANVVLDETAAALLDEQGGERPSGGALTGNEPSRPFQDVYGVMDGRRVWQPYSDSGGASRFFYIAKADHSERPRVEGVAHPTVKPLDLMRWLVRLVTPPGGLVLDPFAGSGTTVEAALMEGFRCVAIEREADYLPLIAARITRQRDPVAHVRLVGDPLPTLFDEDAS